MISNNVPRVQWGLGGGPICTIVNINYVQRDLVSPIPSHSPYYINILYIGNFSN